MMGAIVSGIPLMKGIVTVTVGAELVIISEL